MSGTSAVSCQPTTPSPARRTRMPPEMTVKAIVTATVLRSGQTARS